jgi:hypothetical protein
VKNTTILTAIYDNYDDLKPVFEQSISTKWICVTDNPTALSATGWQIIYEPREHLHPCRASRVPKILPWLYTDTDTSIWIDASFRVISSKFAEEILNYADPIAQYKHPWRNCAYDEAIELDKITKFGGQPFQEQVDWLQEQGLPHGWGLWASGVMARKHTPEVVSMGFDWMKQVYMFSYRDQMSHSYACYKNGIRPVNLPGSYFNSEWISYEASGRH